MSDRAHSALFLGAGLFVAYAYFYQAGGWNQNSRFALARALVVRGSVRIDPDAGTTGDIAVREGHVYCDKAPGASFLAAAALALLGPLAAAAGVDPDQPLWWRLVPWLVTLLAVSVPVALTAAALFGELLARSGAWPALFATAAVFLASPILAYAGLLYGHALAACLLALGWLALVRRRVTWAGFAAGSAILVEYTAAMGALALLLYALSDRELRGKVWTGALAALPPLALLALYDQAAFGSPFAIGYSNLPRGTYTGMGRGFFGLRGPTLDSLWQLSFGVHRGLFRYSPVLLLAFVAVRRSRDAALALALFAAFFLLNASYVYWDGHASFGPRHALPGLLLLAIPIAAAAQRWPRLSLALLVPSLLICGLAWATRPESAPSDWDPLRDSWLHFWRRDAIGASIFWFNSRDPLDYRSGFVLPMLVGLDGRAALLPLVPLFGAVLFFFHKAVRR
jgi:hypothetical protein